MAQVIPMIFAYYGHMPPKFTLFDRRLFNKYKKLVNKSMWYIKK